MTTTTTAAPGPSRATIARATVVALVVAVILLFTVVLPAEYGIDPLGTGNALGLSGLAQSGTGTPSIIRPSAESPLSPQQGDWKTDAIELYLAPQQAVEYKYELKEGNEMVFKWTSTGPVEVDFHTEPEGKPPEASDSFERAPSTTGGSGSYRAPYNGIHGWYWKNISNDQDLRIVLQAGGFFSRAWMISGDERTEMEVLDPPKPPVF